VRVQLGQLELPRFTARWALVHPGLGEALRSRGDLGEGGKCSRKGKRDGGLTSTLAGVIVAVLTLVPVSRNFFAFRMSLSQS